MKKLKYIIILIVLFIFISPLNTFARQIYIKPVTGEDITLEVESSYTVEVLKQMVSNEINISVESIKLNYNGRELEDGRTLGDYDIEAYDTIEVYYIVLTNKIIIKENKYGTIKTNLEEAKENEIIEIEVTPNDGFEIEQVNVYKEDNKTEMIEVIDNKFNMPNYNVVIDVIYKELPQEQNPNTSDNILRSVFLIILSSLGLIIITKRQKKFY